MPAPEIDVVSRGTRIYLTRGTDTDKQTRTERREAVREALLLFDTSGQRTGPIECAPADFPALYGLFQRQRTAQGLGNIRVSRSADGAGIILNNTMIEK